MKFVLVAAVLLIAFYLWRNGRESARKDNTPKPPPAARPQVPAPQDMVSCPVCGLHLPAADAVQGRLALYCGEEHRKSAER